MRKKGKIRSWNEQKAFGFIRPSDGGKDVFLHISGISNRHRVPNVGQNITFILSIDKEGRPCAKQALLPGDRLPKDRAKAGVAGAVITAAIFLSAVVLLVTTARLPVFVCWVYLAMSMATFLVYAVDVVIHAGLEPATRRL